MQVDDFGARAAMPHDVGLVPTAMIRPSFSATASARMAASSIVRIGPPRHILSACCAPTRAGLAAAAGRRLRMQHGRASRTWQVHFPQ